MVNSIQGYKCPCPGKKLKRNKEQEIIICEDILKGIQVIYQLGPNH